MSIRIEDYFGDAPSDGTMYGQRNGAWERITLMPPVDEYWDITEGLPPTPEEGDRYISDGTDEDLGWYDGYVYEWTDGEWIESIPVEGWMVWLIFEMVFWVFFSGGWMEMGDGSFLRLDGTNSPSADIYSSYGFIIRSLGITGPEGDGLVTFTLAGAYTADVTVPTESGKLALQTDIPDFETDSLSLHLNQSTPQRVINDAPHFDGGIKIKSGQKLILDGD